MLIVAKALIFDADGNVLLLRRSKTHPTYALHHDLPGGQVEDGEDALTATAREIFEEIGLKVAPGALQFGCQEIAPNNHHNVLYVTRLNDAKPVVNISWEHDQAEWLPVREVVDRGVPESVDPYYQMALRYLQDHHM